MQLFKVSLCTATILSLSACGGSDGVNNTAPQAINANIVFDTNKTLYTGTTLEGLYSYSDNEQDAEGASEFRWLVDGEIKGVEQTYTIQKADAGKAIVFEVTPVAATGTQTGTAIQSQEVVASLRQYVPFTAEISENERVTMITDGTEAGTVILKDFNSSVSKEAIYESIQLGDKWILNVDSSENARQLAVTDGTEMGSFLLGNGSLTGLYPSHFIEFKDKIFFAGSDDESDRELWSTDGTHEGTQLFKNLSPGYLAGTTPNKGTPSNFTVIGNSMVFTAYSTSNGTEPWVTDGSTYAQMIKDLSYDEYGSDTSNYFSFDGKAFFSMNEDLWVSTGVGYQTHKFMPVGPRNVTHTVYYKDKMVLVSDDNSSNTCAGIWLSDGTSAGTDYIDPKTDGDCIQYIVATDDYVYYTTSTVLYRYSEGLGVETLNGTEYGIAELVTLNNNVYFNATDGDRYGLYTVENNDITLVKKITGEGVLSPLVNLIVLNEEILFLADDGIHGREFWHSDGTESGTKILKDIFPGSESSYPSTCHLMKQCRR